MIEVKVKNIKYFIKKRKKKVEIYLIVISNI